MSIFKETFKDFVFRQLKIREAVHKLKSNNLLEPTQDKSIQNLSLKLLTSIGCSLETDVQLNNRNYTLASDQIDVETVSNPNKLDMKQFEKIKKQKISLEKVFKNPDDSFFKLDDEIARNFQDAIHIEKRSPSVTNIVEAIVDLNYLTKSKTLRSFLNGR